MGNANASLMQRRVKKTLIVYYILPYAKQKLSIKIYMVVLPSKAYKTLSDL